MVALCNRADHYIFALWFLFSSFFLSFFLSFFPRLISAVGDWMSTILPHMCEFRMHVWKLVHAARWKYRTQKWRKNRHMGIIAQLCRAISSQLRHISTIEKNLLHSNISSTSPHYMVNSGPLAAGIDPVVWGIPANFNSFRVLAALLHGI